MAFGFRGGYDSGHALRHAPSHHTGGTVMNMGFVNVLILAMAFAATLPMQSEAGENASPKAAHPAKGKTLFIKHCAGCHGVQGKGDGYKLLGPDPANLTAPATRKKSDRALLATIHEGKPNMPSWKGLLSERDIRNVLAYIRTLPH